MTGNSKTYPTTGPGREESISHVDRAVGKVGRGGLHVRSVYHIKK